MSISPVSPPAGTSRLHASLLGASLLLLGSLCGCQTISNSGDLLGVVTPYRLEVVQGNVITSEQAAVVKTGLTRAQVRDVLGSPLLVDPFHGDRWDYVFTIRRQGAESQLRRIVVLFKDDKLDHIDTGGDLPSERDFVAMIDIYHPPTTPPPLALTDAELKLLPTPAPAPAATTATAAPPTPARTYPPLEPRS